MSISFTEIPTSFLVPGVWVELDESALGTTQDTVGPSLLIVQKIGTGSIATATPTRVRTKAEGVTYCGEGSIGAQMIERYFENDRGADRDLRIIALADAAGAVAAVGRIGLVGPATASGEIAWYVGGRRFTSAVVNGDAASVIVTAAVAASGNADDLPSVLTAGTYAGTLKMTHNAAPGGPGKVLYVVPPVAGSWPANVGTLECDNSGGNIDTTVTLSDASTLPVEDNATVPSTGASLVYFNETTKALCSITSSGKDVFIRSSTGYLMRVAYVTSVAGLIAVYFDDDAVVATDKVLFLDGAGLDDTSPLVTDYLVSTARNGGTCGNRIDLRVNHTAGEALPSGLNWAIVTPTGGATDPDIGDAVAVLGSQAYDVVCHPWGHTSTQDTELDTALATRWGAQASLYGHQVAGSVDTVANLSSLAAASGMNTPRASAAGARYVPSPPWECAAAVAGIVAQHCGRATPAPRPIEGLALAGITPPATEHALTIAEQQTLIADGVLPLVYESGSLRIGRFVSLQITDDAGGATDAGRDAVHRFDFMRQMRRLRSGLYSRFARKRVTTDAQTTAPNTVTLTDVRRAVVSLAEDMRDDGLLENMAAFLAALQVTKGAPTRVDILFPPDLVNPLLQMAVLLQPRLDDETVAG